MAEEAVGCDGCTEFRAFYKVLLPLSLPALAIVFLFDLLAAWGEYFTASLMRRLERAAAQPGR
ncbi:MAG: ABC transporter permease subunit [Chloroflexota bacterium]